MKTIDGNLYDYPAYYDLIFGSDWMRGGRTSCDNASHAMVMEPKSDCSSRPAVRGDCSIGWAVWATASVGWT